MPMPHNQSNHGASIACLSGPEARADPRFRLMMRTAKLVSASGEYFCIVRDISQGGVRLRLFHPLPVALAGGQELELELANGDRYAVTRVWHGDGEAGFRFAGPVDVDRFIAEPALFPRRPVRLRLAIEAWLSCDGIASSVHLQDISQQGVGIVSGLQLETGQLVSLAIGGGPAIYARVRWSGHPRHGLAFERAFRLDELAVLAADWQGEQASRDLRAAG